MSETRESYELDMSKKGMLAAEFGKAVKRAREDDRVTYIKNGDGVRIAAVVPLSFGVNMDKEIPHDPALVTR